MTASLEDQKTALELEKLRLEVQGMQQALATGRGELVAGVLPDLTAARWSSTTIAKDAGAVLGAPLAAKAVESAAAHVRAAVEGVLDSNTYTVVVSVDPDLGARQASYDLLLGRIRGLTASLREALPTKVDSSESAQLSLIAPGLAVALLPLVGKALGAAFSLARTTNTLSSSAGTVSDRTASWAVAGALADASKSATVYLDGMLPQSEGGPIEEALTDLREAMDDLRALILKLEKTKPDKDEPEETVQKDTELNPEPLKTLLSSCVAVESALHTAPETGLSPVAQAKVHEWICTTKVPVVVVQGGATSVDQLVRERLSAKVTVVAAASISYLLVDPSEGWRVRKAGVASGRVQSTGEIGEVLTDASFR